MPVTINGTTGFTFPNGSAGTPSLTGVDTDTGIFFGSDTIAFTEGGTEALRIDGLGNVGLGTTTVSGFHNRIFHMHGADSAEIHLTTAGTGTGASDGLVLFRRDSDGLCGIINRESSSLTLGTADQDRLTISSTGNVGIGTTNPNNNAILDVRGTQFIVRNAIYSSESNPGLYIRNNASVGSSGLILGCDSTINAAYIQPLLAGTTYSHNLVICAMGGGVGIGVTSPDSLLHVGQSSAGGTVAARIQNSNTAADSDAALYLQTPNATYTLKAKRTGVRCDFEIDGTPKISINAISGNVGIGTTNPADGAKLHIQDGGGLLVRRSSGTSVARFGNTSSVTPNITVFGSTTVNEPYLGCDGDNLTFGTGNQERLRIDSNGNVGIGTTNPVGNLHVGKKENGAGAAGAPGIVTRLSLQPYSNTGGPYEFKARTVSSSSDFLDLYYSTNHIITYSLDGNVGIGTTDPTSKLQVTAPNNPRIDIARFHHSGQQSLYIQGQWGSYDIGSSNGSLLYTTGGTLAFRSGGSGNANMVLDSTGKVGIGLTGPSYMLHLAGAAYIPQLFHSSYYSIRSASTFSTGDTTIVFTFSTSGNATYLVTAGSGHYGYNSYSCMRQSYVFTGPNFTETNLHNYTTAPHGSWSFSWSNNVLTVTHNPGNYGGGASFWVVVQGG